MLKRAEAAKGRANVHFHIVRRTVLLFLLGLMVSGVLNFDFAHQRWTGVLQRIAVCYLLASLLVLHTKVRTQVAVFFGVL